MMAAAQGPQHFLSDATLVRPNQKLCPAATIGWGMPTDPKLSAPATRRGEAQVKIPVIRTTKIAMMHGIGWGVASIFVTQSTHTAARPARFLVVIQVGDGDGVSVANFGREMSYCTYIDRKS
jgi:hypothetical protein